MKVKIKLSSILISFFLIWIGFSIGFQKLFVQPVLQELEKKEAIKYSQQVSNALKREVDYLANLCLDWAAWDDSYDFLYSNSKIYRDSNLVKETFASSKIDIILFYNNHGKMFWGKIYENNKLVTPTIWPFKSFLEKSNPLKIQLTKKIANKIVPNKTGLVQTEKGPVMYVSYPVVKSSMEGPARGIIVMARLITNKKIKEMISQIKINFTLNKLSNQDDVKWDKNPIIKKDDNFINIYSKFPRFGKSYYYIDAAIPRKFFVEVNRLENISLISRIVFGILIMFIMYFILHYEVFTPLKTLTTQTMAVEESGDPDKRHKLFYRKDEFGFLSIHFHKMLDKLASTQKFLKEDIKQRDFIERKLIKYSSNLENQVNQRAKELVEKEMTYQNARTAAILGLAKIAEYRDYDTGMHLERIQEFSKMLATGLSEHENYKNYLSDHYIQDLYISSLLHDIGKVGIPDSILLKPGKLSDAEFNIMKHHVKLGGQTLTLMDQKVNQQSFLTLAKEIAFFHHEKWDGTGYAQGLKGHDIPLSARIVAIVDVYDALTSERVYKDAFSHEKAIEIIIDSKGKHFDPLLVDIFLSMEKDVKIIKEEYTQKS